MSPRADYEYDIFFSYKRHRLTLQWTRGVQDRLQYWITQELGGRPVRMFVDEQCIDTGDRWPIGLQEALKKSRCMIAVWSPEYFQSSWCISEHESFRERERRLYMDAHGLIAPLKFHDGEHFPDDARTVQWTDISAYTSTAPAFWQSARAIELEDLLKDFARSVAEVIRRAPEFSDWPIVEAQPLKQAKIKLGTL